MVRLCSAIAVRMADISASLAASSASIRAAVSLAFAAFGARRAVGGVHGGRVQCACTAERVARELALIVGTLGQGTGSKTSVETGRVIVVEHLTRQHVTVLGATVHMQFPS